MSTHKTSRKIEDLLDDRQRHFSPLQRLLKTAANQKQWTQELQACLDAPWAAQVDVTDIQGEVAHLLVHSAAAATKLRFMLPELQSKLSHLQSFSRVRDFRIRVSS